MCTILFGIVMGSYALGFWQPTIIRQTGIKDSFAIGLLTMIPYTAGPGFDDSGRTACR